MASKQQPLNHPDPVDTWVTETLPDALAFAISQCRNRELAEDIVHDCYCRLLQKARDYDLPRDGKKILIRSIANACIDRLGRERVLMSLDQLGDACFSAAQEKRASDQPDGMAMAQELEEAVEEGLNRLSVVQRTALQMKSHGFSLEEIAQTLEISPTNAGVLVFRARQAMARHLAPFIEEPTR